MAPVVKEQPQHEIPIERVVKIDIHRSDLIPYTTTPEHGFLRYVARIKQRLGAMRRKNGAPDFRTGIVDKNAMPVDNVDVRSCLKEVGNAGKRSWQQHIVAIEVAHDVAINAGEARVDRI